MFIRKDIENLKNESADYNKAIDDVLELFDKGNKRYKVVDFKRCNIVHTKTGLLLKGYDSYKSNSGNTLSPTSGKTYFFNKKSSEEVILKAFEGHITTKEDGKKYVWNHIQYSGSEIHKHLSKHYDDYQYLPLEDFHVETINKN